MARQREGRLQRRIRSHLEKTVGGFWFKIWGGPFQVTGLPDLIGCVQGHFFAFEVKTIRGRATPIQLQIISIINHNGGTAMVIRTPQEAENVITRTLAETSSPLRATRKNRRRVLRARDWKDMDSDGSD